MKTTIVGWTKKKDLKEKNWDKITEDVKQFYLTLCRQLKEEKVS